MPKRKYKEGTHGAKKHEQERLSAAFKLEVSGKTHESEHPVGYEPLARGVPAKRGKDPYARELENSAMAYQEVNELHRQHVGTGTKKDTEETRKFKMTSEEYRDEQRALIESGRVGDAIQLNQMGYAYLDKTVDLLKTKEGQAATDSYNRMLVLTDELGYHDQGKTSVAPFSYQDKLEDFIARKTVANKRYRTEQELAADREEFDRLLAERRMQEWKDATDPLTGLRYSSYADEIRQSWKEKSSRKSQAMSNDNNASSNDNASAPNDVFSMSQGEGEPAPKKTRQANPALDNNNNDNVQASLEGATAASLGVPGADLASEPFSLEGHEKPAAKKARPDVPPFAFEPPTGAAPTSAQAAEPALPTPFEL